MGMDSLAGIDTAEKRINDIAMTGWSYSHDREMQRSQAEYNKQIAQEVNSHMAQLQREARINGPSDLVAGLRMAGLNPALASGDSFASTSSGGGSGVGAPSSAPSRESTSMGKLALDALRYQNSERGLMDAQSRKMNADAESVEIDNKNKKDANLAAQKLLDEHLNFWIVDKDTPASVKTWAQLLLDSGSLSTGTLDAMSKAFDNLPKLTESQAKELRNKLETAFSGAQLQKFSDTTDPESQAIRDSIARLPGEQAQEIQLSNEKLRADTALLVLMASTEKVKPELLQKQRELVEEQIKHVGELIKSTHNENLTQLWNDGEYQKAIIGEVNKFLPYILNAGLLGIVMGKGRVGALGTGSPAKTPDVPKNETIHEQWRYNKNGQPTSYKRTHMSGLAE